MRIALTGASGFIGSAIVRTLHRHGHTVTALVRESSRRDHIEPFVERFVVGDQADELAWGELLEGSDAVVHDSVDWHAIRDGDRARHLRSNLLGSIEFLRAATQDQHRPFVFISTIAVHHDMSPRWDGAPDEDHPLRPGSDYGAYKAGVEAHLWADHYAADARGVNLRTVALRPCAVYGVDPNLDRSHGYTFIKAIAEGKPIECTGGGKFVHVDDVALAVLASLTSKDDALVNARPFNLVDCYARWCDIADMAGELLAKPVQADRMAPVEPKNMFEKDNSLALVRSAPGLDGGAVAKFLNRGHAGLREHMRALIEAMREQDAL